jgi:ABC-type multidrug transport system ATPase subunit
MPRASGDSSGDLDHPPGEIFALLGPNGAGKTTLISIVCGIVNASTGRVRVAGPRHEARTTAPRAGSSDWCRRS